MVAFRNPPPEDAGTQRLHDSVVAMDEAAKMDDADLAEASLDMIIELTDPKDDPKVYAILSELLNRFEACAGIERDEESGEIIASGEGGL